MLDENTARELVGEEVCLWLDDHGFRWSNNLPYTMEQGWTNTWMSFICDENGVQYFSTVKKMEEQYQTVKKLLS